MKKSFFFLTLIFIAALVGCSTNDSSQNNNAIVAIADQVAITGNSTVRVSFAISDNETGSMRPNIFASVTGPFVDAILYREDSVSSTFERKQYKILQKKRIEVSSGSASIEFNSVPESGLIGVEVKITGGNIGGIKSFYGSGQLGSSTVDVACRPAPSFTSLIPFHEVTELKTLDGKSLQQVATLSFQDYGVNPVIFNDSGEPLVINSEAHLANVTTGTDYGLWTDFKFNNYNVSRLNWFDNKLLAYGNNSIFSVDLSTKAVLQYIGTYGSFPIKTQDNVSYASATIGAISSSFVYNDKLYMVNVSGTTFGQIIYAQNGRVYVAEDLSLPEGSNYFPDRIQMTSDGSLYVLNYKSTYRGIHKRVAQGSFEYIGLPYSTSSNPSDWVAAKEAFGHTIDKVYSTANRKIIEYHNGLLISTMRAIIYSENGKAWAWLKSKDSNEDRGYDIFKNKNGDIYIASLIDEKLFKLQP